MTQTIYKLIQTNRFVNEVNRFETDSNKSIRKRGKPFRNRFKHKSKSEEIQKNATKIKTLKKVFVFPTSVFTKKRNIHGYNRTAGQAGGPSQQVNDLNRFANRFKRIGSQKLKSDLKSIHVNRFVND